MTAIKTFAKLFDKCLLEGHGFAISAARIVSEETARRTRKWSSKHFAEVMNVSVQAVNEWRRGESLPTGIDIVAGLLFPGELSPEIAAIRDALLDAHRAAEAERDAKVVRGPRRGGSGKKTKVRETDGPPPAHKPDNLPFRSIKDLFIGRDKILDDLHASLSQPGGSVTAIVHGLGGIGKTRTAVEYALRNNDRFSALLFVRAPDRETLDRELAGLASVLRLPAAEAREDAVKRAAVLRWLEDTSRWLLILDNVDTPEALAAADALARTRRTGHVLLTTRLSELPDGVSPVPLDLLTQDDATNYLLKATKGRRVQPDDEIRARELAETLDRLTLALVYAAAYIRVTKLTFAGYLERWHAHRDDALTWANETMTGYPLSLARTWLTSVEQLSPAGRTLLERLSFFANDPVPETLMNVPPAEGLDPLIDLARYSLVTRDDETPRFTVHRILRDVTNRRLKQDSDTYRVRLVEVLSWINAAIVEDPGDVRTWPSIDPLVPHAEAVAWAADAAGIAPRTARLFGALDLLFSAKAQYDQAEIFSRRALAITEGSLGPADPAVATCLNNLAALLEAISRLEEAEPLLCRAIAIYEAALGSDHPNVATCLNNLARLLHDSNRVGEAEPLIRRALAIDEARLGPDHPDVARDLNTLAALLQCTCPPAEVEPLFRRALEIDETSLGPHHPNVARDLNNLAGLLLATNRLEDAEPLFRRALAIHEAHLGRD